MSCPATFAQSGSLPAHVPESIVALIGARFRHELKQSGIAGVSRDIQVCYDVAFIVKPNREPLSRCLLYDIAATRFDRTMRDLFVGRGMPRLDGTVPYFSRDASTTRLNIYGQMVFGAGGNARSYFGDAPSRVQKALNGDD
jgi:hypothetical protein